jgi:hypothetical protein
MVWCDSIVNATTITLFIHNQRNLHCVMTRFTIHNTLRCINRSLSSGGEVPDDLGRHYDLFLYSTAYWSMYSSA